MRRIHFSLFIAVLCTLSAFSQSRKEWLEYGDDAFKREDYGSAAYFYMRVIDPKTTNAKDYTFPYDVKTWMAPLDSTKRDSGQAPVDTVKRDFKNMTPEIRYQYVVHQIAESYRLSHDYVNAEIWYAKSAKNKSAQFPDDLYYYGRTVMQNEKYMEALKIFESVTKDSSLTNTNLYKLCIKGFLGCRLAIDTASEKRKSVVVLDTNINQGTASFAPGFFDDDLEMLLFAGARKDGKVLDPKKDKPEFRTDFYTANKSGSGWQKAQNMGLPFNSEMNEGAGCLSINKDLFYFTRWDPFNPRECAIWVSKFLNGKWLPPQKLGPSVNVSGFKSMQPNLSFDGTKLYFSSDRPGGKGKMDIWYAEVDDNGNPGTAYNLGPKVNSPENEVSPYFHWKTSTLYFASDGHPGFGALDLFKVIQADEGQEVDTLWSIPLNLKKPINSSKDDVYFVIQSDQKLAYFSSDRETCKDCGPTTNCMKIYSTDKEPLLFRLSGVVSDRETGKPIANALLTFKDVDGNVDPFFLTTDDKGFYQTDLREDFELYIKAQKNKYFGDAGTVSTKGMVESRDLVKDFQLSRIPEGEIVIPGIEYDFDKATLRPESKKILDDLAAFLTLNNQVYIQINSHTDCRGSDAYNLRLSKERAKSCLDYLIMKGIDPKRLMSEGFGESQPFQVKDDKGQVTDTYTCDWVNARKTEAEKEAAHQKNRRTAFVVVKEDELKDVKKKKK